MSVVVFWDVTSYAVVLNVTDVSEERDACIKEETARSSETLANVYRLKCVKSWKAVIFNRM
jgi:hypothetical protein